MGSWLANKPISFHNAVHGNACVSMGHCCHPAFIQISILKNNKHLRAGRDFFESAQCLRHNYVVILEFRNSLIFSSGTAFIIHMLSFMKDL